MISAMQGGEHFYLGVDVGGTFIDLALVGETSGKIYLKKYPNKKNAVTGQTGEMVRKLCETACIQPDQITYCSFGTTAVTNAIITRSFSKTGLITTRGFRDTLEIARQVNPDPFNPYRRRPDVLVPRSLRLEVNERLSPSGVTLEPLDKADVVEKIQYLKEHGVEAIAVTLLHSYVNSAHEKEVKKLLEDIYPEAYVSISSDVHLLSREFERTSSTVVNVSVRKIMNDLIDGLNGVINEVCNLDTFIMRSDGGAMTQNDARLFPVYTVESGPAAGVIIAAAIGASADCKNVLGLDIGGTTAKAALVEDGKPHVIHNFEVGGEIHGGEVVDGSGYPVMVPVIDLAEIGAGGGSIASVSAVGELKVGPQSAGADPGPACYGWGGTEPTICDANLVLGRINPFLVGGEMSLDQDRAKSAIKKKIADKLGISVEQAADAIIRVANNNMILALKRVSVKRGRDPRDYAIIATGGGGAQHVCDIASELNIRTAIIPEFSEIASAVGMIKTDVRYEESRSVNMEFDSIDEEAIRNIYTGFVERLQTQFESANIEFKKLLYMYSFDICYKGQSTCISISVDNVQNSFDTPKIASHFELAYKEEYGYNLEGAPLELVNVVLTGVGVLSKPAFRSVDKGTEDSRDAQVDERKVYFTNEEGFITCPVYARSELKENNKITGPALIDQYGTVTVLPPGWTATAHRFGHLILHNTFKQQTQHDS